MMDERYPVLPEKYDRALREIVRYIRQTFDVVGIVAAGSVIRGEGDETSDLDVYAIHTRPERQMIQQFFVGVATQIFLNPPAAIERYFADESAEGNCSTAHMLTTGFVVLDAAPVVSELRERARQVLATPPNIEPGWLTLRRYHVADLLENALDMIERDPLTADMLLGRAVFDMLQYAFLASSLYLPRDKDLLRRTAELDPTLGQFAQQFYAARDLPLRVDLAGQIADQTIQTRGFFEWQTPFAPFP